MIIIKLEHMDSEVAMMKFRSEIIYYKFLAVVIRRCPLKSWKTRLLNYVNKRFPTESEPS